MPVSLGGPASNSRTLIVDSWPIMEWFKNRQPAADHFRPLIESAQSNEIVLLLSTINLGEIYYNCWNEWDEARAEGALESLLNLPIRTIHPSADDVLAAARIKAEYKVAYADAFAAILTIEFESPVLTGDKDFLKMQADGLIAVDWVGA